MRLIFVTDTLSSGGAERVVSILANHFSCKFATEIICLRRREVFFQINPSVKIVYACDDNQGWLNRMVWIRHYVRPDDVVIPFMVKVYCVVLLSLIGKKITIIASERNDPRSTPLTWKWLRWILLHKVNRLVVQTKEIKNYFSNNIQKKTDIIMNPVEIEQCSSTPWDRISRTILAIGRTDDQKNYPMMIRAFNKIRMNHPEYRLDIWGNRNMGGVI